MLPQYFISSSVHSGYRSVTELWYRYDRVNIIMFNTRRNHIALAEQDICIRSSYDYVFRIVVYQILLCEVISNEL